VVGWRGLVPALLTGPTLGLAGGLGSADRRGRAGRGEGFFKLLFAKLFLPGLRITGGGGADRALPVYDMTTIPHHPSTAPRYPLLLPLPCLLLPQTKTPATFFCCRGFSGYIWEVWGVSRKF